jgi:ubiquinone/menaquinone biosynthesis C-methylase UbiE
MDKKEKEYWSKYGSNYDDNQLFVVGMDLLNIITSKLSELSKLGNVLELGCGTGYFTKTIYKNAETLIASDISEKLLKITKKKFEKLSNIKIQKENCMNLSFSDEQFNTVFMANLIHVIENPLKTLEECYRVLKNKGTIILASFTNSGMTFIETFKLAIRFLKRWGKPPKNANSIDIKKATKMLELTGFKVNQALLLGNKTKAIYIIAVKD